MDLDNDFVSIGSAGSTDSDKSEWLAPVRRRVGEEEKKGSINSHNIPIVPKPTLPSESKHTNVDPIKWHTLSSLLPLLQLLPAFKKQSGYYILSGPVTDADISLLSAHANMPPPPPVPLVPTTPTPFTVLPQPGLPPMPPNYLPAPPPAPFSVPQPAFGGNDFGPAGGPLVHSPFAFPASRWIPGETRIAASVYARLLRYLHADLLPSLECLRIDLRTEVNTELQHVYPLLVVPTLLELELEGITPEFQHVTLPLLSSLPYETPALQKLILRGNSGYCFSSEYIGPIIASLTELCHLELYDVPDRFNIQLFNIIGHLPKLTTFIFRDTQGAPSNLSNKLTGAGAKGFKMLRHLSITAPFKVVALLLRRVESSTLESLEFAPVVDGLYDEKDALNMEIERIESDIRAKAEAEAEEARIAAEEARVKAEAARAKADGIKIDAEDIAVEPEPAAANIFETPAPPSPAGGPVPKCSPPARKMMKGKKGKMAYSSIPTSTPGRIPSPTPPAPQNLEDILEIISTRWKGLQSLTMGLVDTTYQNRIFELPSHHLSSLRSLGELRTLQLENWKVVMGFQASIQSLAPSFPMMKKLSLPLGNFSSPVNLRTLQIIAESCPVLESLQVAIAIGKEEATYKTIQEKSHRGAHPLQVLSIGSTYISDDVGMSRTIKLARQMDKMFPRLENMTTHIGQAEDVWNGVWDLLQLCHDAREVNVL
ncbi:hypothetical protein BDQ17DRAFT_1361026 [Cyathus striatus]|nr:hypothetical protein BDQ17DRAFT_1361026 [Cyathus striatus]